MNDATIKNDESGVISMEKSTAISTVGYLCLAATWWMTGMLMANWFSPATTPGLATGTIYGVGSALLVIIGILSLVYGHRMLDSIVFLSSAGLFFSLQNAHLAGLEAGQMGAIGGYVGWYALIWAVFFCYLWISSFGRKTGTIRMLFLLLFWLGALAAAIGGWIGSAGFEVLSGYLLLVTAILAFIVSAEEILGHSLGRAAAKMKEKVTPPPQAHPGMAS